MASAADFTFDEIQEQMEVAHLYSIDAAAYEALTGVFQDLNPLHTDDAYARALGFSARVMHGAILQGFLSNFVGMRFPGRRSLLLSVTLNYRQPSYLGDEVLLTARVKQKVPAERVIVMDVRFSKPKSLAIVASGRVQVAVKDDISH